MPTLPLHSLFYYYYYYNNHHHNEEPIESRTHLQTLYSWACPSRRFLPNKTTVLLILRGHLKWFSSLLVNFITRTFAKEKNPPSLNLGNLCQVLSFSYLLIVSWFLLFRCLWNICSHLMHLLLQTQQTQLLFPHYSLSFTHSPLQNQPFLCLCLSLIYSIRFPILLKTQLHPSTPQLQIPWVEFCCVTKKAWNAETGKVDPDGRRQIIEFNRVQDMNKYIGRSRYISLHLVVWL